VALFVVIGFPHTSDCDRKSKAKIISGVWSRHVPWRQAVSCHFDATEKPSVIRLHMLKDEVILA